MFGTGGPPQHGAPKVEKEEPVVEKKVEVAADDWSPEQQK